MKSKKRKRKEQNYKERPRKAKGKGKWTVWSPIGTDEPMHNHVFSMRFPKRHAEYLLSIDRFDRIKLMRQAIIDAVEDRVFEL